MVLTDRYPRGLVHKMNIVELKDLWKEVFGDSDAYLDIFFSKVYTESNTLVHYQDGKVAAALYMIPYELYIGGKSYSIMYLYALATKAEYRRKGIMTELIKQAHVIGTARGYISSVLIPACQDLYAYYNKMGYNIIYYQNKLILSKNEIETLCRKEKTENRRFEIESMGEEAFQKMYEKGIRNQTDGIRQSERMNNFYLETLRQDGGKAVSIFCDNKKTDLYALIGFDNQLSGKSKMILYETNAKNDDENLLLISALARNYEFQELEGEGVESTGLLSEKIDRKRYAMIHPLSNMDIEWNNLRMNRLLL